MPTKKQKLYIIHGWTYTTEKWDELIKLLKKAGYDPVMLNVPGLTEESSAVWTLQDYVDWLESKLKKAKDPIVIGHSNGGRIAIAYDTRHPGKISQLFLMASAGVMREDSKTKAKRKAFGTAAKLGKRVIPLNSVRKIFYKLIGAKDYGKAPPNMRKTMVNMLESDKTLRIDQVTAPTVLIWGTNDTATPISDAYKMDNLIHNSILETIIGAEHSPHDTHTEFVRDILIKHLEGAKK